VLQIDSPQTPIEEIKWPLLIEKGLRLFIKREDISHPYISGNKWRKLKYHLLEADKLGKNTLVTYGGAFSNHILATAAAGAKYGFRTYGFIRGERVENTVLQLSELFGMELHFVSRTDYKEKNQLFQKHFGLNQNVYEIPEGGGGEFGEKGVAEMLNDLHDFKCNHLFTSVGTGSTLKGILQGIEKQNLNLKAHGIVVLKGAEEMASEYLSFDSNLYQLHFNFHRGGYAKSDSELIAFIKTFASKTGILLDQVYEGKMLMGIISLAEQNFFKPGETILAIHNGGVIGLTGLMDRK
jgi:1-aminocyclopropane-1-carboxylate deaminase